MGLKIVRLTLHRFKYLDRLSYLMTIAFGICLLIITLQFQFGKTVIVTPEAIIHLDNGYITETNQVVRIAEGLLSLGLIALGVERLIQYRRGKKRQ